MIAKTSTPTGPVPVVDACGCVELLVALVEREQAADGEEHDRDEEGVDVALAAVAEGVLRRGGALGPLAADEQQRLVAGVGERVDASASIDDEPLSAKATNLVTAIPMFASKAATTALFPPPAMVFGSSVEMQRAETTKAVPEPRKIQRSFGYHAANADRPADNVDSRSLPPASSVPATQHRICGRDPPRPARRRPARPGG